MNDKEKRSIKTDLKGFTFAIILEGIREVSTLSLENHQGVCIYTAKRFHYHYKLSRCVLEVYIQVISLD